MNQTNAPFMRKIIFVLATVLLLFGCHKTEVIEVSGYASINVPNDLPVGKSAHDLLSGSNYTGLDIELQYMPGVQLQAESVNNLVSFLNTYLNKPDGITVNSTAVPSIGKTTVSLDDIASYEKQHRTAYNSDKHLRAYVLVADAGYTTQGVIGVAYRNTSLCIFGKTVQASSGSFGQVSRVKLETGVLEHEWGHLLGLVNNGTPMVANHEDTLHKVHCTNKNCLMYYETETGGFSMLNTALPTLDASCTNDLKTNGGK
jgi:hypothetical protein